MGAEIINFRWAKLRKWGHKMRKDANILQFSALEKKVNKEFWLLEQITEVTRIQTNSIYTFYIPGSPSLNLICCMPHLKLF